MHHHVFSKIALYGLLFVFGITTALPQAVFALEFNPNLILNDAELTDYNSMTVVDIQKFLEYKGSYLAKYTAQDVNGEFKKASTMIYEAAQRHRINPRYILTTLQKEQSLIEGVPKNKLDDRLDWAAGYGICDSCNKNDPTLAKFRGFGNQVDYAAGANRFYIDNPEKFSVRIGQAVRIDGQTVIPQTQATVNQYIYTPHIHGNKNLWSIWNNWFTRRYPNGTVLQAVNDTTVWLIREGKKHLFETQSSFLSRYDTEEIIKVNPDELENYELGASILFPNYSLLRLPNGLIYLLLDETKRPLASQDVLRKLGYNPDEIIDVGKDDVRVYETGKFITIQDSYPTGAVLKNRDNSTLYYAFQGTRRVIANELIAKINYPDRLPITVDSKTIADYPLKNEPILLRDGTLVKTPLSNQIYIISDSRRRPIPTMEVFNGMGFNENAIKEVDEITLLLHPKGEPVRLNNNVVATTQ
ncbi:MAG TPA: hypothetical protein DDW36_03510 [Candidatus Magasanikbacteria bacterium]|nr:hypothetical protein [Candidatus Magasanikbacteria bacterium]